MLATEQDFRCTVPQSHNLVRECLDGDGEGTCQAKVSELQDSLLVHKDVLGLQVTVDEAVHVAVRDAHHHLEHKLLRESENARSECKAGMRGQKLL